jgi:hypothetical protein
VAAARRRDGAVRADGPDRRPGRLADAAGDPAEPAAGGSTKRTGRACCRRWTRP